MKIIENIIEFVTKKEVYGILIILALSYFFYQTLGLILDEIINRSSNAYERKRRTTITNLFKNIVKYVIIIIAFLATLHLYGFNIGSVLTGLGITAGIIGLAFQDTLKDLINGISIILENYFVVGDIVRYNDFTGTVISFGLRSTKIKNHAGETLMINNRNIYEIVNISQQNQNVQLELHIAYEEDIEDVENVITKKILPRINKIESVKNDSPIYLGVNGLEESYVKYLIQYHCDRDSQWRTKREALKIVKQELDKAKIKIPYQQLEVHTYEAKV